MAAGSLCTLAWKPVPSPRSSIYTARINSTQSHSPLIHLTARSSTSTSSSSSSFFSSSSLGLFNAVNLENRFPKRGAYFVECLHSSSSSSSSSSSAAKTRLYVSGLSFRTTEESLKNAFQNFGQLVEVNLVMDKIAKRPRGFAFLRYTTEEESQNAIEGMHGKFLDGRVIFVEVAKPRSELRQGPKSNRIQY